jgi:2-alkyl-3-oxoalkanoate reductase
MRVFVTGATGVLGRRSVRELLAAGHEVSAVARSAEKAAELRDAGATPVAVSLFDLEGLHRAVGGHQAVVNLATNIPSTSRMARRSAWKANDDLRTLASRNLVDAALDAEVERFVQESITFQYADGGSGWLDEAARVEPTGVTASAAEAEAQAARFTASGGTGSVLRFAQLVAPDSVHLHEMLPVIDRGWLPLVGDADGYESYVDADDAAAAVAAALSAPAGIYNVSDDEPLTRREHAAVVAGVMGRPVRLPPVFVGRVPVLRTRARSQRVSSRRLQEVSPWAPRSASMRGGWPAVLSALKQEHRDAA